MSEQENLSFCVLTFRCPVCLYENCTHCEPCIFEGGEFKPKLIIRLIQGWNHLVHPINWRLTFARIDGEANFLTSRKHIPNWFRIPTFSMDWRKMQGLDWTYGLGVVICKICGSHFYEEDPRDHVGSITEDDIGEDNTDGNNKYGRDIWKHDIFDHEDDAKPLLPFISKSLSKSDEVRKRE